MSNVIIFYDIPSSKPGQSWSSNTWRIRYALNYKAIPYETVWVEYPDIEGLCKKIGALPTEIKADGTPHYTLPVIHDPSTNTTMSESILIAEYLDAAYPNTPKLFPPGTHPLQHAFIDAYLHTQAPLAKFIMPRVHKNLGPASEKYFRSTREKTLGATMETMTPTGAEREVEWAKVKKGFNTVDGWLRKGEADGPYFLGRELSFADFVVGARLKWIREIFGEDSHEWRDMKSWNNGRWGAFVEGFKRYETVA